MTEAIEVLSEAELAGYTARLCSEKRFVHVDNVSERRMDEKMNERARKDGMKRFFAAARREGLDMANAEGMRYALAEFLGVPVWSRKALSGGQWAECLAGLSLGLIAW